MEDNQILVLRDNAKNELLQIKSVEDGITYLNKLKSIEVWVKAEQKDAELQNMVAEQKLRTQRIIGQILSNTEKQNGARGIGSNQYMKVESSELTPPTLEEIGLSKNDSSAFQQIAKMPEEKFEAHIEEMKTSGELTTANTLRAAKGAHVSNNSGESEWYTPAEYTESAKKVMGKIDLDPASSEAANKVIKAKKYFDEKINGLVQKWHGCIWMNPPYSQPLINDFIQKLETEEYDQAIVLVNNATETRWGQKLLELCNAVCFHTGRIRFVSPEGEQGAAPLQGQMIAYIGKEYKKFITEFSRYGICLKKGV